jgi:NADPH:quinone reductase-like Zn-dependent oxidoreductase
MKSALVLKPAGMTFEQAASSPIAALTALQGLRDKGRIQPGQKVLVNGASGGVGTYAVQIARSFGAEVTGVCSTGNVDLVRSIGAHHVIDYTREDFTKNGRHYDILLDCVGNRSLAACRRVLSSRGILVMVGVPDDAGVLKTLGRIAAGFALSPLLSRKMVFFIARANQQDLTTVGDLIALGKVNPVIDRCYRLSEIREAFQYMQQGHTRGKVIVIV